MKKKDFYIILLVFVCTVCAVVGLSSCFSKDESVIQEKPTIEIWHIWTTDTDANKQTFEYAVEAVREMYPDVNIEVIATETETYKTRIKTSIALNDAPDIFFTWGAGFSEPFVTSDKILCLDEYYDEEMQVKLPWDSLNNQIYNDSLYGLPIMESYAIMYTNEEIVSSYGYSLPLSFEDMLELSEKLNKDGIVPVAVAGADLWPMMFHYASMAVREVGPEMVVDALSGKVSFDQQGFVDAGYKLLQLADAGAYGDNYLYAGYDEAADMFKNGEAAMFFMGSWASGGFKAETYVSQSITATSFFTTGGKYDDAILGGLVDCFMISKSTEHPELAAGILKVLTETMSDYGSQNGMGLPAWSADVFVPQKSDDISDEDFKVQQKLYEDTIATTKEILSTSKIVWWDVLLGPKGYDCNRLIIDMMSKDITPEQFVQMMDELINDE